MHVHFGHCGLFDEKHKDITQRYNYDIACWCNKKIIAWLCVCTGDNLLAKARELSSRTYGKKKTCNNLHLNLKISLNTDYHKDFENSWCQYGDNYVLHFKSEKY